MRIIFTHITSSSSFFNFKDNVPAKLLSNRIYSFGCSQCQAIYLENTSRYPQTRVADKEVNRPVLFLYVQKPKDSRRWYHSEESNPKFDFTSFKVLKLCHPFDIGLTESASIHKTNQISIVMNIRSHLISYHKLVAYIFEFVSRLYFIHVVYSRKLSLNFPDDRCRTYESSELNYHID